MIEVIVTILFVCVLIGSAIVSKINKNNFMKVANDTELIIDTFVEMHNLDTVDYELHDLVAIENIKKKLNLTGKLGNEQLGAEHIFHKRASKKGYDFTEYTHKAGHECPVHRHEHSTEFIYVITGQLQISFCEKSAECELCLNGCALLEENVHSENISTKILNAGDSILIPNQKFHKICAILKSRCISITMPSIFKE